MKPVDELIVGLELIKDWEELGCRSVSAFLTQRFPEWRVLAGAVGLRCSSEADATGEVMRLAKAVSETKNVKVVGGLIEEASLNAGFLLARFRNAWREFFLRLENATPEDWIGFLPEFRNAAILAMLDEFPGALPGLERDRHRGHFKGSITVVTPWAGLFPADEIRKLRGLMMASGDAKSLHFLDAQWEERRRGYAPVAGSGGTITVQGGSSAGLPSGWSPRYEEEERAVERILRIVEPHVDFLPPLPRILYTEDEPPLFRAYPMLRRLAREEEDDEAPRRGENEAIPEVLNIESLLGFYRPNPTVVLYSAGLRACAKLCRISLPILFGKVLAHELGHWVSHAVSVGGRREWELSAYGETATYVHEAYAQLFAHWTCTDLGTEWLGVFVRLNAGQSAPYRAWKDFEKCGRREVIQALSRLREIRPGASLRDMKVELA